MADRRLVWNQLNQTQPNVAGLLANANASFNDGLTAAQSILGKYDDGLKAKGDQELARLLADTNDREELSALVNSDAVKGLRLSDKGVTMLNQAQGNRVDWANVDSTIADRAGRLGIAQDVNSRQSEAFGWDREDRNRATNQRDWLEDNAGSFLDSELRGLNNGSAFSAAIDRKESGGGVDQYDATLGFDNRNNGVRVSQMTLGEASEYSQGQYAQESMEWKRRNNHGDPNVPSTPMGKFQIVGSTLRQTMQDLQLPSDIPFSGPVQEQLGTYLGQQRVIGKSQEAARAGLRNEWEGFKNKTDAELDVIIDELRNTPPVTRESVIAAGQSNNQPQLTQRGFGGDDFAQRMAASGLFTPQQILGNVDPLRVAARIGDQKNLEQLQQTQKDYLANFITNIAADKDVTDPYIAAQIVQEQALTSGKFSDSEALEVRKAAEQILSEGSLGAQLSPTVEQDVRFTNIIDGTNEDIERGLNSTVIGRMNNDIKGFAEAESPTAGLQAALGPSLQENAAGVIGGFFTEGKSGADSNDITNLINRYADKFNVSPVVAAAAMREAFIDDPLTIAGFGANTLERRFDQDAVGKIIEEYTNQESQSRFNDDSRTRLEFEQTLTKLNSNVIKLQEKAAKTRDPVELQKIAEEISAIYVEMSAIRTEAQNLYGGGTSPSFKKP